MKAHVWHVVWKERDTEKCKSVIDQEAGNSCKAWEFCVKREKQSFPFISYNFIPEARSGTLTDRGVLPYASELGYGQRLDYKVVN